MRTASVGIEVDRVRADEDAVKKLRMWVQHYFGETTPGVATAKFHAAIERLMGQWDQWYAAEIGAAASDEDDDDEEAKDGDD